MSKIRLSMSPLLILFVNFIKPFISGAFASQSILDRHLFGNFDGLQKIIGEKNRSADNRDALEIQLQTAFI